MADKTAGNYFDQFDQPATGAPQSGNYFDQFDAPAGAGGQQNTSVAGDLVTDAKRGIEGLPGALTGAGDVAYNWFTAPANTVLRNTVGLDISGRPFDTAANWLGEKTGFTPGAWAKNAENEYTQGRQQARQEIDSAWNTGGVKDVATAYATNPMATVGNVVESVPSMLAGGAVSRGLMAVGRGAGLARGVAGPELPGLLTRTLGERAGVAAGAVGEGIVTAGQNMDQADRSVDPMKAALAAGAAGVGTGLIGYGSGRFAQKMGLEDIQTAMANGRLTHAATGEAVTGAQKVGQKINQNWYTRIPAAMLQEGLLEEFPQSAQEQIWQNLAEGKPWHEGVTRQAVEGALAGAVMGGGINLRHKQSAPLVAGKPADVLTTPEASATPSTPGAPRGIARVIPTPLSMDAPSITPDAMHQATRDRMDALDAISETRALTPSEQHEYGVYQRLLAPAAAPLTRTDTPTNLVGEQPQEAHPTDVLQSMPVQVAAETLAPLAKEEQQVILDHVATSNPKHAEAIASALAPTESPKPGTKAALQAQVNEAHAEGTEEHIALTNAVSTAKTYLQARLALAKESPEGLRIALRTAPEDEQNIVRAALGMDAEGNAVDAAVPSYDTIGQQVGVSRQRVQQVLKKYGIDAKVISRMAATQQDTVDIAELAPSQQAEGGGMFGEGFRETTNPAAADDHVLDARTVRETKQSNEVAQQMGVSPTELAQPSNFQTAQEVRSEEIAQANREAAAAAERARAEQEAKAAQEPQVYRDHRGLPIQQVDIEDAAADYDAELLKGDLPFAELPFEDRLRYVRGYIAAMDKAISAQELSRIFGDIADANRVRTEEQTLEGVQGSISGGNAREAGRREGQATLEDQAQLEPVEEVSGEGKADSGKEGAATGSADVRTAGHSDVAGRSSELDGNSGNALRSTDGRTDATTGTEPVSRNATEAGQVQEGAPLTPQDIAAAWNEGIAGSPLATFPHLPEDLQQHLLSARDAEDLQRKADDVVSALLEERGSGNKYSTLHDVANTKVVESPTRSQAANLLRRSQDGVLRGVRDPDTGKLYVWDAYDAHHNTVIKELGLSDSSERLTIDDLADMPEGVFSGEPGYGKVAVGDVGVQTTESSMDEWNKAQAARAKQTTADIIATIKKLFFSPAKFDSIVNVVQSIDSLPATVRASVLSEVKNPAVVQGFVGEDGKVYLIADNIAKGKELAVFLHEVGVHLGMERLIGKANMQRLSSQIEQWAAKNDGIKESQIAKAALARAENSSSANKSEESIAYFIEEAVNAGIDPVAVQKIDSPIAQWMNTLWEAVKSAMKKLGLGRVDSLTAQDLVNIAYGAAQIELDSDPVQPASEVKFSEAKIDHAINQVPYLRQQQGFVRSLLNKFSGSADMALPMMFGHQLERHVAKWLPSSKQYFAKLHEHMAAKEAHERDIARIAEDFQQELTSGQQAAVNSFLHDSTREQKWGYAPSWNAEAVVDPEFAKRFEALRSMNPKAADIVQRVFQHGHDVHAKLTALINDALPEGEKKVRAQLDGPYAPLKRFGNYVVVAKSDAYRAAEKDGNAKALNDMRSDEKHYYVEFKDTEAQAINRAIEVQQQMPDMFVDKFQTAVEAKVLNEMGFQTFKRLEEAVRADDKMNKNQRNQMVNLLNQLYVASLNREHARKSELRRENVAGADKDMMRSFIAQGRAEANLLASLQTNEDTQASVQAMRNEVKDSPNRMEASKVLNEILKRQLAMANYRETPVQDALMKASSLYHILLSPMYYFTNATQPAVISLPVISGKHGAGRSTAALTKAYQDIWGNIKLFNRNGGFDFEKAATLTGNVGNEQGMLETLAGFNLVQQGTDIELGNIANQSSSALGKAADRISGQLHAIARNIESVNRVSTALAAYRLEYARQRSNNKANDAAHEAATMYARDVLLGTHGDYSGQNAPRAFMQGNSNLPVKVMLQFRKYQLIQVGLLVKLFRDGWINDLPADEKAAAKASMRYLLSTQAALCGLMGLPAVGLVSALSLLAGGPDGEDEEARLRRVIGDPTLAQLLLHGAPAALGVDVSKRMGMGNVFSVIPFAQTDRKEGKDAFAERFLALGGAPTAMAAKVFDGLTQMEKGRYWRGLEAALPNGLVSNISKVARYESEGVTTRRGDILFHPEDISFMDDVMQTIGAPTTKITDRAWKADVQYKTESQFKAKSTQMQEAYARASRDRDVNEMSDLRSAWQEMQSQRQELGFKRAPLSELLKAPADQRKRELHSVDGLEYKDTDKGFVRKLSSL